MPDNILITQGQGTTLRTDEISGVHYLTVKLALGLDGSATLIQDWSPGDFGTPAAMPTAAHTSHYIGGGLWERVRIAKIFKDVPATSITAGTPITVWTPTAGTRFRLLGFALSTTVNTSIIFKYGASNTTIFRTPLIAANNHIVCLQLGNGVMPGAVNDALKLDVVASATVAGFVCGVEE